MPLRWEILHSEKLIHVVADGEVTLEEMEAYLDALVVANALAYSKLFDAAGVKPVYDDADMMAMGARMSAYASHFASGPLAVVGHDEAVVLAFKRFVNISSSKRPAAIFKTEKKARAWLAAQSGG